MNLKSTPQHIWVDSTESGHGLLDGTEGQRAHSRLRKLRGAD